MWLLVSAKRSHWSRNIEKNCDSSSTMLCIGPCTNRSINTSVSCRSLSTLLLPSPPFPKSQGRSPHLRVATTNVCPRQNPVSVHVPMYIGSNYFQEADVSTSGNLSASIPITPFAHDWQISHLHPDALAPNTSHKMVTVFPRARNNNITQPESVHLDNLQRVLLSLRAPDLLLGGVPFRHKGGQGRV